MDAFRALLEGEHAAHQLPGLRLLELVSALTGLAAEGAPHLEKDLFEHAARKLHGELEIVVAVAAPLLCWVCLGGVPIGLRGD